MAAGCLCSWCICGSTWVRHLGDKNTVVLSALNIKQIKNIMKNNKSVAIFPKRKREEKNISLFFLVFTKWFFRDWYISSVSWANDETLRKSLNMKNKKTLTFDIIQIKLYCRNLLSKKRKLWLQIKYWILKLHILIFIYFSITYEAFDALVSEKMKITPFSNSKF